MAAFELGTWYSARDIHNVVGGELQTYLTQKGGEIVAGRFNLLMNPEAPGRVYVGDLPRVREKAELLSRQRTPIPVFIKSRKSDGEFKYAGLYRAQALLMDIGSIEAKRRSRREELAGVLELEHVGN